MSKSYKKHSFIGNACYDSLKKDKQAANRKLRRHAKEIMKNMDEEDFDEFMNPDTKETSNRWMFADDGRSYISVKDFESKEEFEKYLRK